MRITTERAAPVYMKIRQSIFSQFSQMSTFDECIPSENELCKLYKVSRSTIRKALKDLIDEGFLIPCPGKGTFVNVDRLKNSFYPMASKIGFTGGDGKSSFFTLSDGNIFCGAMNYVHNQGKLFQLINLINTGEAAVDEIVKFAGIRGLLWFNPAESYYETIRLVEQAGMPIVTIYKSSNEFDWIGIDQVEVGRLAGEYLIKKGCKKILETYIEDNEEAQDRIKGLQKAFEENGIKYDGRLRLYNNDSVASELEKMISYGLEIDGIFAIGSFLPTMLETFKKLKIRVGKDIELVSVNSSGLKFVADDSIPYISLPYGECGQLAAQQLIERIDKPETQKLSIKLKPKIIK